MHEHVKPINMQAHLRAAYCCCGIRRSVEHVPATSELKEENGEAFILIFHSPFIG